MAKGTIEVQCPCCQTVLRVDAATGVVLTHKEVEKPAPIEDISAAVAALKGEAARREDAFQKSFEAHKSRQSVLDRKFEELFREASNSPNEKPFRPDFDLD